MHSSTDMYRTLLSGCQCAQRQERDKTSLIVISGKESWSWRYYSEKSYKFSLSRPTAFWDSSFYKEMCVSENKRLPGVKILLPSFCLSCSVQKHDVCTHTAFNSRLESLCESQTLFPTIQRKIHHWRMFTLGKKLQPLSHSVCVCQRVGGRNKENRIRVKEDTEDLFFFLSGCWQII